MNRRHDPLVKIAQKIIRQAIKDLKDGRLECVKTYVESETFVDHLKISGYPNELNDTLRDAVLCSNMQRQKICEEVLILLEELEKERPRSRGQSV